MKNKDMNLEEELEELNARRNKIHKKLRSKRKEKKVENNEAFYCKECGEYVEIPKEPFDSINFEHIENRLCDSCYETKKRDKTKNDFMEAFGNAQIVDAQFWCYNHKYNNPSYIIIEDDNGNRFTISPNCSWSCDGEDRLLVQLKKYGKT